MLMGVRPDIKDGVTQLGLDLQGKGSDDIDAFWDRLEKTGSFRKAEWTNVTITDQGLHRMTMNVLYTARPSGARPAAVPPVEKRPAARPEDRP